RAQVYFRLGEYAKAIDDCTEVIALEPTNGNAYALRANLYYTSQDLERAEADSNQAISLEPTLAAARGVRGRVYCVLREYAKAIHDFDVGLRSESDNPQLYVDRASAYHGIGKHDCALADSSEAIRLNPTYAHAWYIRGQLYLASCAYPEAVRDF